jgi:hypothetical protein
MANLSVDGVASLKQQMMEKEMEEHQDHVEQVQNKKMIGRSLEQGARRAQLERDRIAKVQELRAHRVLLMKVERRFQAFPFLAEKIPPLSAKPSLPELVETDELQKLELNLQGSERRLKFYIEHGALALEGMWGDGTKMTMLPANLRWNLKGLHEMVSHPIFLQDAEPLIMETIIEYPTIGEMNLPFRWAQCVISTLYLVHKMNSDPKFKEYLMSSASVEEEELDEEAEEYLKASPQAEHGEVPAKRKYNKKNKDNNLTETASTVNK